MNLGEFVNIEEEFFKRGYLLSPEAKKLLENRNWKDYLNKNYERMVLMPDDFADEIRILKNLTYIPERLTTDIFLKFQNSKYDKMKKIFIERIGNEFVSINKIGRRGHVSVIGIVRNIKEKEGKKIIEIEDITGLATVIYKGEENVALDDVIGVRGTSAGNVIYADEILFPGVPIRSPTTGKGKICIISGLDLDESPTDKVEKLIKFLQTEEYDYLIVIGNIGDVGAFENFNITKKIIVIPGPKDSKTYPSIPLKFSKENIISLSNPSMIEINGVKILLINNFNMNMLKKRYLGKSSIILNEDYLVLDILPDIIVSNGKPSVSNYKSITIINSGTLLDVMKPVVVNLETRDWKEIEGF